MHTQAKNEQKKTYDGKSQPNAGKLFIQLTATTTTLIVASGLSWSSIRTGIVIEDATKILHV